MGDLDARHLELLAIDGPVAARRWCEARLDSLGDSFGWFPYPLLGRMATAEEQAWPLVLPNSPLSAVVTGTVLYTDQGFAGGVSTGSLDVSPFVPGP